MMKLSIITINYNNLAGLKNTVGSVERQSSKEFEWVVIDGGSLDGSKELIEEHSSSFDYWVSEPDKGIYNAMNKAIKVANGEYFLFLNSGDYLASTDIVEKILPELTGEDYIFANVAWVNEDGIVSKVSDHRQMLSGGIDFFYNSSLCHQGMFIKGSTLKEHPYNEHWKIVADWEHTLIQLVENNGTYRIIDSVVANVLEGGVSMADIKRREAERRKAAENHFPAMLLDSKRIKNMVDRKSEFTNLEIATFACAIAMEHRYDSKTYREIFAPYKSILTQNGSKAMRLYNWLNLNGFSWIANILSYLKGNTK